MTNDYIQKPLRKADEFVNISLCSGKAHGYANSAPQPAHMINHVKVVSMFPALEEIF